MGSIETIIGFLLIFVAALIYDLDIYYTITLPLLIVFAVILIVAGIGQIIFAFMKNPKE